MKKIEPSTLTGIQCYCPKLSWIVWLAMLVFTVHNSTAQKKATSEAEMESEIQRIVESFIEDSEEEVDVEALTQNLAFYYQNPLNLNKANFTELSEFRLLSIEQIASLILHRKLGGDLLNIYELQSIKYFDLNTIDILLPFVKVEGEIDDLNIRFGQLVSKGDYSVFARFEQTLETRKGQEDGSYLGNPHKYYLRYQYKYGQNISYGFTAEKDAGEPFGGNYNRLGFDFYSYHIYFKDYGPFKYLALGDYKLNLGQGLTLWSGFSTKKSDIVMGVMKNAYLTKRFTSVTEYEFNRGAAATIELGKINLTAFGSHKPLDANVIENDTLAEEDLEISSFQTSGLHRTENELEDKNSVKETMVGTNLNYQNNQVEFGVSGIYTKYNRPLKRSISDYNQFQFNGNRLVNASFNYRFRLRNLHFFGEWATSNDLVKDNANKTGLATVNGVLLSIDPKVSFTILFRHFNKYYEARYAKPFSESTRPNNETGLYFASSIKPSTRWQIDGYADFYKHQWLRFSADAPSHGFDYRTIVTYKPSRKVKLYMRYKNEVKQENLSGSALDFLVANRKTSLRIEAAYKLTKALRFKTRVERTTFKEAERQEEEGILIYQDINLKPKDSPISFYSRFCLFDTDSYETRIYVYENSPLYAYANRNFFKTGYRYYFGIKYQPFRNLDTWFKFERTKYLNTKNQSEFEGISSGNQFINDDKMTGITLQARLKF